MCHTAILPAVAHLTVGESERKCIVLPEFHVPVHAHVFCWQNIFALAVEAPVALMSVLVEMLDCKSALNSAAPFDGLQRMSQQAGESGERRDDGQAAA